MNIIRLMLIISFTMTIVSCKNGDIPIDPSNVAQCNAAFFWKRFTILQENKNINEININDLSLIIDLSGRIKYNINRSVIYGDLESEKKETGNFLKKYGTYENVMEKLSTDCVKLQDNSRTFQKAVNENQIIKLGKETDPICEKDNICDRVK